MSPTQVYCSFWINELHSGISHFWTLVSQTPKDEMLPCLSTNDLADRISNKQKNYRLTYTNGDTFAELKNVYTDNEFEFEEIVVLRNVGSVSTLEDSKYSVHAHSLLDIHLDWLVSEDSEIQCMDPNFGSVQNVEDFPLLIIGTPIFKRVEVSKVFLKYMLDYFLPQMRWEGYNTYLLLVGSEEDQSELKHMFNEYVVYVQRENYLGTKKNTILNVAKSADADFVMWIDSDDFFHPKTASSLIDMSKYNGYWSAIEDFSFYNTQKQRFTYFSGYDSRHNLSGWGMGSGRVFTREAMIDLENPFPPKNKNMDDAMKTHLKSFEIDSADRLLRNPSEMPLGVKTKQNIWNASSYGSETMRCPNWIPKDTLKEILDLEFDNKDEL